MLGWEASGPQTPAQTFQAVRRGELNPGLGFEMLHVSWMLPVQLARASFLRRI